MTTKNKLNILIVLIFRSSFNEKFSWIFKKELAGNSAMTQRTHPPLSGGGFTHGYCFMTQLLHYQPSFLFVFWESRGWDPAPMREIHKMLLIPSF